MNRAAPEEAMAFDCEGETLVGVLHHPAADAPAAHAGIGVVVIVGGPQYRAGSHRQFLQLARALAAAGHPVLRFDVRGMGDSTGALRSFEQITPDIGAAIDALQRRMPQVRRVALWGLCDGASAALLYLDERADARVRAVCLLNPWVRSDASRARTNVKHYYVQRLGQAGFWAKLLKGRVAAQAPKELIVNLWRARSGASAAEPGIARPYQMRMADGWRSFGGSVLLVLSSDDYTAKEFQEFTAADPTWRPLLDGRNVLRHPLVGADHTLSSSSDKRAMSALAIDWLRSLTAASPCADDRSGAATRDAAELS
jgi:exosortase A-associated hydrolase 1